MKNLTISFTCLLILLMSGHSLKSQGEPKIEQDRSDANKFSVVDLPILKKIPREEPPSWELFWIYDHDGSCCWGNPVYCDGGPGGQDVGMFVECTPRYTPPSPDTEPFDLIGEDFHVPESDQENVKIDMEGKKIILNVSRDPRQGDKRVVIITYKGQAQQGMTVNLYYNDSFVNPIEDSYFQEASKFYNSEYIVEVEEPTEEGFNKMISFFIPSIEAMEQYNAFIRMETDIRASGTVKLLGQFFNSGGGLIDSDTLSEVIVPEGDPYDPNAKSVNIRHLTYEDISDAPKELEYTIRFQNLGDGEANKVVIRDSISDLLDFSTFEHVDSKYDRALKVVEKDPVKRTVTWKFFGPRFSLRGIEEPGFNCPVKTKGWIRFKIKTKTASYYKENNGDLVCIKNEAGIVFDDQPRIKTNKVSTCIYNSESDLKPCTCHGWVKYCYIIVGILIIIIIVLFITCSRTRKK